MTTSDQGIRLTERIGGVLLQTYYTPDGRTVRLEPSIVETPEGLKDRNLRRGLLLSPPTKKRPHCPHCDGWHDNQKQIDKCGVKRKAFIAKHTRKAKKELAANEGNGDTRIAKLESDMADIKTLLQQLVKGKQ